ncbi:adenylyltransferase and sulfurtransferase MOCS3 [Neopelma chrysocephalum]|uniref:adenylyltransferase and sulfurtransferase MOCS3 n=1 Tax=Neopelma chrysocephalum TaxID=114329 RepID=UPI000FCD2E93|nr:adenylyltransferase and sulfurtransferase MOCS3 [Neopelma chrysocephalum]
MAGAGAARLRAEIRRRERELRGLRDRLRAELARGDTAERQRDEEEEEDGARGPRERLAAEVSLGDAEQEEDGDGGLRDLLARGDAGSAEDDDGDDDDDAEGAGAFPAELPPLPPRAALSAAEIARYSRQLLLPELGVRGQLRLARSSVLVVGCGGLGCPLAQYLAAAGVGRLGLLDHDVVETSNLHRQVLHGEARRGRPKAASAAAALRRLNSAVQYVPYRGALSPRSALRLVRQYDIVADCSDNAPTRYLVNDACVLAGKPLVSGSALRLEGQLVVYNYRGGPCYRCLFPKPPPPDTVTSCADGGVLGVVPGIIGCMQALEVLKIASGMGSSFNRFMLMFDALEGRFRNIKLRPKKPDCAVCGDNPTVTCLQDYEAFCGSSATDKCRTLHLLPSKDRISVEQYKKVLDDKVPHVLLDVRPQVEVDICRLEHAVHIPLSKLQEKDEEQLEYLEKRIREEKQRTNDQASLPVYVVCKLGNDSQKAVKILQELPAKESGSLLAKDIKGGLMAWATKIDPTFPQY